MVNQQKGVQQVTAVVVTDPSPYIVFDPKGVIETFMSSCVCGSKVPPVRATYALRVLYQLPKCYINFL